MSTSPHHDTPTANHLPVDATRVTELPDSESSSYGQILKSSAWIGGASALTTAIGIARTKAMALMLDPAGFGLMGIYGSIADLARSIVELGINSSGVRRIAEAVGSGDTESVARTVTVLRRTAIVIGVLGATLLFGASDWISTFTFGNYEHASAIALLSIAVLCRLVADGQSALIQGMRRVADLAKMGVFGALFGTIVSIPVVYMLQREGVALSLVGIAAMGIVTSWWYSRKVRFDPKTMTVHQVQVEVSSLLKLGFAFMASGLLMMAAAYAVRTMVLRVGGADAAGLYSAAWTIGGLYVGIILQAMGADFYPRLVAAAQDNRQCNRLVNEQTQVGLLLAVPGVIATLTLAPLAINLLYSAKFIEATEVLRWLCVGMTLRIVTWPIGFIIVAKNRQITFLTVEVIWTLANVSLTWVCLKWFGLPGAGMAFVGAYLCQGLVIYAVVHRISGFRWSGDNAKLVPLSLFSVTFVFLGFHALPSWFAVSLGLAMLMLTGVYALRAVVSLHASATMPGCSVRQE